MWLVRTFGWLLAILCGASGCGDPTFQCADDSQCTLDGVDGFCELNGYCSFPDDECNTGRRYGSEAPSDVAGTCVKTMGDSNGGTGSGTPTTASPTGGPDTDTPTTTLLTTTEGSTSETSGESSDGSSETGSVPSDPNIVFVSSQPIPIEGEFVESADALCNDLATESGLPGSYVAWLTTSETAAISRLQGARGWLRPDGAVFADRVSDIASGAILHPPLLDERGDVRRDVLVYTGTAADGTASANCGDWTLAPDTEFAIGTPDATWPHWTQFGSRACTAENASLHVYCFGIDGDAEVGHEPIEGRRAFMSVSTKDGGGGRPAFDAICEQEATAAGLDGTFLAFVATDAESALSRFDAFGDPWVNMAGVPLTAVASDLLAVENIDVAANYSTTGAPVTGFFWTGSRTAFDPGAQNHCEDWTAVGFGLHYPTSATSTWMDYSVTQCSNQHHVLCFEE